MPLTPQKAEKMGTQILRKFYSCTIEYILTGCITAWYGNCSADDRKALHRVVRTVLYITGTELPAIQDLYTRRCHSKALKIVRLQSPKSDCSLCYRTASGTRALKSRRKRLLNSFFTQVIKLLNS
jgi:gmma-aminobutyric acid receptor subunit gamma